MFTPYEQEVQIEFQPKTVYETQLTAKYYHSLKLNPFLKTMDAKSNDYPLFHRDKGDYSTYNEVLQVLFS